MYCCLARAVFWLIVSYLNDPRAGIGAPLELFFGQTVFFWLVLLFVAPVLTMRLLAEERRSGTIEVLMTAPVSEGKVVEGKYLAALAFYLWLAVEPGAVRTLAYNTIFIAGFTTIVVGITLLGGIQLITLGIAGEYIGRIFDEVKQRPLYTVREVYGFDER